VIKDVELYINDLDNDPAWHLGVADLMSYLKNTLKEFHFEDNKIINPKQQASRALLEAIQIISLPLDHSAIEKKVEPCIMQIAKYGNNELQNKLRTVFKKQLTTTPCLFEKLLAKLDCHLKNSASEISK